MSDERRVHERTDTRTRAEMRLDAGSIPGRLENVGAGGVFFATEELEPPVRDGERVTIAFACRRGAEEVSFECAGRVLRGERYFDGDQVVRAFAVKFAELIDLEGLTFDE